MKICGENPDLIKIGEKRLALCMRTKERFVLSAASIAQN
jgi:hypothetical protein